MVGETDLQRHERLSQKLDDTQGQIRALMERLSHESVDEEEPFSLPTHRELEALLRDRQAIIQQLVATEEEIMARIGLPGDPEEVGSIDIADVAQVGGAEPGDEL
jgi:hypothetical protein